MSGYKVLGTTTDVTFCECCGRTDLRKTVMMVALDADGNPEGDAGYYGTSCAARLLGTTAKKITDQAAAGDKQRREAEEVARRTLDKYADVDGLFPRDAVLRYAENNWRHTSGMDYSEILDEVREMVADARAVLGLDKPAPTTTEEPAVKPVQVELFDTLPLLGQTTVEEHITAALEEPAAAPAPAPTVEAAPELPGDGSLFALRITDTPDTTTGALFGLGI